MAVRFWDKVAKIPFHECWEWVGGRNKSGYGTIGFGGWRGPVTTSNRAAWILAHGSIPPGMMVLHHCDNRLCVNPDHLWLGTAADNAHDMVNKNRQARGVRNAKTKLSELDVPVIRRLREEGLSALKIARRYGLGESTVRQIVARQIWKWVE